MPDMKLMTAKEIMRWFRKRKKLTLEEVADEIGVSYVTMRKYECDPRTMTIETFDKLNKIYGYEFANTFFKEKLYKR